VDDIPNNMADFYKKYGEEVKALRIEMGSNIFRRVEDDDRPNRLKWMIASMAVQELMSSVVAAMFPTREARAKAYPEIMKMLIADAEKLCEMREDVEAAR